MSDIICVTNRVLCQEDFLKRIARIAAAQPRAIILREKDLPQAEYRVLALKLQSICAAAAVPLLLNNHIAVAQELGCGVQVGFALRDELPRDLPLCGVSLHSAAEASADFSADFIIAGHIWDTACKAGTPGRGTEFLKEICAAAPDKAVYAIGGVTPARMPEVYAAGAQGACIMSGLMTCQDPAEYLAQFTQ